MISQFDPQRLVQAASAQKEASHPATSVFVSASAGSGKTKILIDRILRLMLPYTIEVNGELVQVEPTSPERILCLTFTKAAAAEMMERLRRELSIWFKVDEPSLVKKLESIGVMPTPEVIKEARTLLGKVLEASGGMKIQTIHSFCQSLLQRFPSESHLVPNFELIDDLTQNEHLEEGLEKALEKCSNDDFRTLLKHYESSTLEDYIFGLCKQLSNDPNNVVEENIDRNFLKERLLNLDILQEAQGPEFEGNIKNCFKELKSSVAGLEKLTASQQQRIQDLIDAESEFLKDPSGEWFSKLLTKQGTAKKPPSAKAFIENESFMRAHEGLGVMAEQTQKAFAFRESLPFASLFAMITLETFKHAQNLKQAFHHLTYGDLLLHTRDLLENVEEAWVRYKLDGGIDHILLDEVQDNSDLQWKIVRALRDEFFENTEEANKRPRTIFEVGDFKQSIYSFQGAEPDQFFNEKKLLQETAAKSLCNYTAPELQFSFRTHQPLLDFVNATFLGIDSERKMPHFNAHKSIKSSHSGRVEVWPLITPETVVTDTEEDNEIGFHAACKIADFIAKKLKSPPDWLTGRSLKPEDIMVLVRKRGNPDFLALLESLLKRRGIATVNGAKFDFKEHVVVQDLISLCRVLLLPADNLSVAKVLLSPIGGLDHNSLNDLILENGMPSELDINSDGAETLWQLLGRRHKEQTDWTNAYQSILELWSKVDYDGPYTLLSRALGACGGYDRYCARFGKEVFEILDAFLNFALDFEAQHVSSLEGFVNWFDTENLELKREDLKTAKAVQLMTVHAAKGLESKMVILADVPGKGRNAQVTLLPSEGSSLPVVLSLTKGSRTLEKIKEEEDAKEQSEIDRLLYVALTRPVEWFVCVGWVKQDTKDPKIGEPIRWLDRCKNALLYLKENGDKRVQSEDGMLVLNGENSLASASIQHVRENTKKEPLPAWILDREKLSYSNSLTKPLRPSKPEGAEFGIRPFSFSPLTGETETKEGLSPRRRGILVHMLLQLLPDISEDMRESFAYRWASLHMKDIKSSDREKIITNCLAILNNEKIKPLFSADASVEQPISGVFEGNAALGRIDRVLITDNEIWLADYKTGKPVFSSSYLKQLQIYAHILRDIKPHAKLHVFLIWTQTAQVQEISSRDLGL